MPDKSEMLAVGNVSSSSINLSTTDFFMHSKKISGFNLIKYMREDLSTDKKKQFFKFIQDDINSGGKMFSTMIAKEMKLEEWSKALD